MREGQGSQEVRAGGPRRGQERRLSLAGRGVWLDLWLSLCERAPEEKDADPTEALLPPSAGLSGPSVSGP